MAAIGSLLTRGLATLGGFLKESAKDTAIQAVTKPFREALFGPGGSNSGTNIIGAVGSTIFNQSVSPGQSLKIRISSAFEQKLMSIKEPILHLGEFKSEPIRADDPLKSIDKVHTNIINALNIVNKNTNQTFEYVRSSVKQQNVRIEDIKKSTAVIHKSYNELSERITKLNLRVSDLERKQTPMMEEAKAKPKIADSGGGVVESLKDVIINRAGWAAGGALLARLGAVLAPLAPVLAAAGVGAAAVGLGALVNILSKKYMEAPEGSDIKDYFDKEYGGGATSKVLTWNQQKREEEALAGLWGEEEKAKVQKEQALRQEKTGKPPDSKPDETVPPVSGGTNQSARRTTAGSRTGQNIEKYEIKKQSISMQSTTDMTLKAGQTIEQKARKIILKADDCIRLDAPKIIFSVCPTIKSPDGLQKLISQCIEQEDDRIPVNAKPTSGTLPGGGGGGGGRRTRMPGGGGGGGDAGKESLSGGFASSAGSRGLGGGSAGGGGGGGGRSGGGGLSGGFAGGGSGASGGSSFAGGGGGGFGGQGGSGSWSGAIPDRNPLRDPNTPAFGSTYGQGRSFAGAGGSGGAYGGRTGVYNTPGGAGMVYPSAGRRRGTSDGPRTTTTTTNDPPRTQLIEEAYPGHEKGGTGDKPLIPSRDDPNKPADPNDTRKSITLDDIQLAVRGLRDTGTSGLKEGQEHLGHYADIKARTGMTDEHIQAIRYGVSEIESKGNYSLQDPGNSNYGRYQYNDNDVHDIYKDVFKGERQPTRQEILKNPSLQEKIYAGYLTLAHQRLEKNPVYKNASVADKARILAMSQQGVGNAIKAYQGGVPNRDANGFPVTGFRDRINEFLPGGKRYVAPPPPNPNAKPGDKYNPTPTDAQMEEYERTRTKSAPYQSNRDREEREGKTRTGGPVDASGGNTEWGPAFKGMGLPGPDQNVQDTSIKGRHREHGTRYHAGADYYVKPGEDLMAQGKGKVVDIIDANQHGTGNYGHTVVVEYENGKVVQYSHLSPDSAKVKKGDDVNRGQVIATTGASGTFAGVRIARGQDPYVGGDVTPPHVHIEVVDKKNYKGSGTVGGTSVKNRENVLLQPHEVFGFPKYDPNAPQRPAPIPTANTAATTSSATTSSATTSTTQATQQQQFPGTVDLTTRQGVPTLDFERLGPTAKGREKGTTSGPMEGDPKGIIFHHTEGNSVEGAIEGMNKRRNAVQYIIGLDKDGNAQVYQTLPGGHKGAHISSDELPTTGPYSKQQGIGISNANTIGIELVGHEGNIDPRITTKARELGLWLMKTNPNAVVLGHGDVNPRGKEGKDISTWLRENAPKPTKPGQVVSDASPDPVKAGQQYAGLTTTPKVLTPQDIAEMERQRIGAAGGYANNAAVGAPLDIRSDDQKGVGPPLDIRSDAQKKQDAASVSTQPAMRTQADVNKHLADLASKRKKEKLNWKGSVVDTMKLLGMDSSSKARIKLAKELGYTGPNNSRSRNVWLQQKLRSKLLVPPVDTGPDEGQGKGKRLDPSLEDQLGTRDIPPGPPLDITSDAQKTTDNVLPDQLGITDIKPERASPILGGSPFNAAGVQGAPGTQSGPAGNLEKQLGTDDILPTATFDERFGPSGRSRDTVLGGSPFNAAGVQGAPGTQSGPSGNLSGQLGIKDIPTQAPLDDQLGLGDIGKQSSADDMFKIKGTGQVLSDAPDDGVETGQQYAKNIARGNLGPAGKTEPEIGNTKDFTFYYPGAAPGGTGKKIMEGPMETARPGLTGSIRPSTLDDYRLGISTFVTVASPIGKMGQHIKLGDIEYRSPIDGKIYKLSNVPGYTHDTGSDFKASTPFKRDIAVGDFSGINPDTGEPFTDITAHQFSIKYHKQYAPGTFDKLSSQPPIPPVNTPDKAVPNVVDKPTDLAAAPAPVSQSTVIPRVPQIDQTQAAPAIVEATRAKDIEIDREKKRADDEKERAEKADREKKDTKQEKDNSDAKKEKDEKTPKPEEKIVKPTHDPETERKGPQDSGYGGSRTAADSSADPVEMQE